MTINIRSKIWAILPFLIILVMSIFYFAGILQVPFHPDESTQIFMSSDIDIFFGGQQMSESDRDLRQHYREVDAPITRYLIGIGRIFFDTPPLVSDWNWEKTWQQNVDQGSLPTERQLFVGRISLGCLFPFSLYLIYRISREYADEKIAWLAPLFLSANSLIVLHTRRAMAEGVMIFGLLLFLWLALVIPQKPWLLAIPAAIAVNCKQSLLPTVLVGLVLQFISYKKITFFKAWKNLLFYSCIFIAIVFCLNPFLWKQPVKTSFSALRARFELSETQAAFINELNPEASLDSIPNRLASLLAQSFLTKPAIYDVGNYTEALVDSSEKYFSNPMNGLTDNIWINGFFIITSLWGMIISLLKFARMERIAKFKWLLLVLSSTLQGLFLIFLIPVSFQRYYLPILPYVILWSTYCLSNIRERVTHAKSTYK